MDLNSVCINMLNDIKHMSLVRYDHILNMTCLDSRTFERQAIYASFYASFYIGLKSCIQCVANSLFFRREILAVYCFQHLASMPVIVGISSKIAVTYYKKLAAKVEKVIQAKLKLISNYVYHLQNGLVIKNDQGEDLVLSGYSVSEAEGTIDGNKDITMVLEFLGRFLGSAENQVNNRNCLPPTKCHDHISQCNSPCEPFKGIIGQFGAMVANHINISLVWKQKKGKSLPQLRLPLNCQRLKFCNGLKNIQICVDILLCQYGGPGSLCIEGLPGFGKSTPKTYASHQELTYLHDYRTDTIWNYLLEDYATSREQNSFANHAVILHDRLKNLVTLMQQCRDSWTSVLLHKKSCNPLTSFHIRLPLVTNQLMYVRHDNFCSSAHKVIEFLRNSDRELQWEITAFLAVNKLLFPPFISSETSNSDATWKEDLDYPAFTSFHIECHELMGCYDTEQDSYLTTNKLDLFNPFQTSVVLKKTQHYWTILYEILTQDSFAIFANKNWFYPPMKKFCHHITHDNSDDYFSNKRNLNCELSYQYTKFDLMQSTLTENELKIYFKLDENNSNRVYDHTVNHPHQKQVSLISITKESSQKDGCGPGCPLCFGQTTLDGIGGGSQNCAGTCRPSVALMYSFLSMLEDSAVVAMSWLAGVLLQCNDIETNPGPVSQLTVPKVMESISLLAVEWFNLGIHLKLPLSTIEDIAASCSNVMDAKARMISVWLRMDPGASWETLTKALEEMGYAQLSHEIRTKYLNAEDRASISSIPKSEDLFSIPDIDSRWREIGACLSISEETLDAIDKKCKNVVRCKREMFKEAIMHNLTWKDFLAAFSKLQLEGVISKIWATMEFQEDVEDLTHPPSRGSGAGTSKSSLATPESQRLSSEARSDSSTQMDSSLLSSSVPSNCSRSRSPRLQSLGPTHTVKSTNTLSAHSESSQVSKLPKLSVKSSTQPIASTGIRQDLPPASLPAPPTSIISSVNQYPMSSSLASLSASVSSSMPSQSVTSSLPPQPGLKVFKQYNKQLLEALSNPSTSSIVFANKMHSLNLITRGHLYELRGITSDTEKIAKMLEYLEESVQRLHKNFELFVACLKSYKEYSRLAETLSRAHYLQLVLRNMQKISSTELNFNAFCHALSDHKLIPDSIKQKAMSSQDPHKLFSIIYTELKTEDLGEAFLDGLRQFQNTKIIASQLEDSGISSGKSFDTSTDITLPVVTTGTQDLQFSLPESVKKRSQEVESDNFMSAESSLRDRSVDVFHDSLSQGDSSVSTRKDFVSRPRIKSNGSMGRLGSNSNEGKVCGQGGEGDEPHEVQEMGSEGSTPQNHSSRPTTERLLSGDEGSIQSREQQLHFKKLQELDPSFQQRQREKEAAFVVAVKKWDQKGILAILQEKIVSVDHRFEKNRTALMLASIDNQKEATRLLIKHRASLTATDVKGYTPLYLAAKYGNYELMRILLEEPGVDVNIKSKLGVPVIVRTAQKGFSVITEFLLENGAQVELSSEQDGLTALYAAIKEQQKDVVKILLEHNADVSYVNPKTERTPLEEAVAGDDPEIVSLIMKAESKTKIKSKQLFSAKTPDEIKDLVIKHNAKIDCRNPVGATPLIAHTISGHLDIVKKLIQLKANIDLQDNMGYSALIVASKAGHIELVRLLIASGAILDLKEKDNGYTGLMFAIINVHVPVVKELVLAKANINLRNRDHKSAIDLAKEGKNTEIMEIVKVQSASSSGGDDPFVQLLSNYMSSKAANPRLSSVKTQDSSKSLKSRPNSGKALSLSTYKPPLTSAAPDETSSMKADLEKCYKRIADLEIRVHDLSIASSMDVSKDEDVSYMDKSRLETEYKKLKEAKKKAEQYAVEAKQTAQRLSAENFKLREDLNKERHFNELTRKTIVKEVEKEMELNAKQKRLELVRQSVFQEKVAERAYQLIESDPSRGTIYQKVPFTGAELKSIIMNESIRMNMFHVVVDGLPDSGKSTLCLRMGIAAESQVPSGPGTVHGLDLYEAALSHSTRSKPYHQWVKFTELKGHDNSAMDMLAVGLLYFLVSQHQVPQSFSLNDIDPTLFDDPEIQNYFVDMCKFLQKISVQFSTEKGTLEKLLTGPFSLVNIFSIFESKPMREILQTIGGQHPNVLLLDLLDISKYDKNTLLKEEDQRYYGSALHHLGACIEAVSYEEPTSPRCIVIGTHRDKVKAEAKVEKQANDIMKLVCSYASDMGVPESVIYPKMICLDTKNSVQCEAVTKSIVDIIEKHKETYEINIPLKFILLRWYLHKTKERFLTRPELIEHARKCGVDIREVDRFLAIFRACGSIISTDIKEEFLHDHFILLPIDFFQDLCKLYTMDRDGTIPREYLTSTKYGVVSDRTLRSLWQGKAGEISVSDFYIRVLDNFGLLADLGNDQYYIPSVKTEYDSTKTPDGDSLIITTNRPYIPLRKQVEFVKYFQSNKELKKLFVFSDAPPLSSHNCCNVTYFKQRDEKSRFPVIRVRFMLHHIEFSVLEKNLKDLKTYSLLKTALVDIMNNVGKDWKPFRYTFNICCPNTKTKPKSHFVPFDISSTLPEVMKCSTCGLKLNSKDKKLENRQFWIEAAFTGSQQSLVHPEDVLNPKRIQRICRELTRKSTSSNLIRISKLLNDSCFPDNGSNSLSSALQLDQFSKNHRSLDDVLFHSIYTWHCHNVTSSKITLAKKLMESGYYSEAFSIAPSLYQSTADMERETIISRQAILTLADWWPLEPVELAKILKVKLSKEDSPKSAVDMCISLLNSWIKNNSGGDQRKKLSELLEKNEYYPPMDIFQM